MKPADSTDFCAMMFMSLLAHAWIAGLLWHFYFQYLGLGLWFYGPLILTCGVTMLIGTAFFGWLGELMGLWSRPK